MGQITWMGGGYREDKVRQCRSNVWSKAGVSSALLGFHNDVQRLNYRPQKVRKGLRATVSKPLHCIAEGIIVTIEVSLVRVLDLVSEFLALVVKQNLNACTGEKLQANS